MVYEHIAEYIKVKGIKQRALADSINVSPHTMCDILAGRRKLSVDEYAAICRFLEVSYDRFIK